MARPCRCSRPLPVEPSGEARRNTRNGSILKIVRTDSIEPAENEQLVASVLESTPGYEPVKLRHSFPPDDQMDGAFAAALRRV